MPRTEVYQLRLSKPEKDEMGRRAREQNISIAKWLRQRMNLDASAGEGAERKPVKLPPPSLNAELDERGAVRMDRDVQFASLVAKHKLRMPTPAAEKLARKELE